jgi:hypothetical protein
LLIDEGLAKVPFCHPELVSGSHDPELVSGLILLDAEINSA